MSLVNPWAGCGPASWTAAFGEPRDEVLVDVLQRPGTLMHDRDGGPGLGAIWPNS